MPDTIDYVAEDGSAFYGDAAGDIYIAGFLPPPFQPPSLPAFNPGVINVSSQFRRDVVDFIDDEILWRSGPTRR
jgi:hypothetical protein